MPTPDRKYLDNNFVPFAASDFFLIIKMGFKGSSNPPETFLNFASVN